MSGHVSRGQGMSADVGQLAKHVMFRTCHVLGVLAHAYVTEVHKTWAHED